MVLKTLEISSHMGDLDRPSRIDTTVLNNNRIKFSGEYEVNKPKESLWVEEHRGQETH